MRILVVLPVGRDIFLRKLISRLEEKGLSFEKVELDTKFVRIWRLKELTSSRFPISVFREIRRIKHAVKRSDVVWIEWAYEHAAAFTRIFSKTLRNKPVILRLHASEVYTVWPSRIEWKVVNKLVLVAHHMIDELLDHHPSLKDVVRSKAAVIHNGVDVDEFTYRDRKPGYEIAWVAHVKLIKNPQMAVQIIDKLRRIDQRYKLHIAGSMSDKVLKGYLDNIIKELGLENNVVFHGWIEDVNSFLDDMNFLLHTSIHESFGYAIFEAMAKGIKPVVHTFKGVKELLPEDLVFKTVDEAVNMIVKGDYNSRRYREWVMEKGYTLEEQVKEFQDLLVSLNEGSF